MAIVLIPNVTGGGGGITQLTGGGLAGPGAGAQVFTLAQIPIRTPALGEILYTIEGFPAVPAAGSTTFWADNIDLGLMLAQGSGGAATSTVFNQADVANQWLKSFSFGRFVTTQPAFTDLAGSIVAAQLPAFTGDVTKPAASTVQTLANIPDDVTMAGDLLATGIAVPAAPGAGKTRLFASSLSPSFLGTIDSGGNRSSTARSRAAVASNWLTSFDATLSTFAQSQPAFSDISGVISATQAPGRLLAIQVLTTGTVSYAKTAGTTMAWVRGWGAGGGGGGVAAAAAGQISMAVGGGGGAYFERLYTALGAGPFTVAVGGGGVAGANTGALAGGGGNTTFTDGTTLCTALGGQGAPAFIATGTTAVMNLGGAGAAIATNGQINRGGAHGGPCWRVVNTGLANQGLSGDGAPGPLGGGQGQGRITSGAGNSATANSGAGGGGALALASGAAAVGGTGGAGELVIFEFA